MPRTPPVRLSSIMKRSPALRSLEVESGRLAGYLGKSTADRIFSACLLAGCYSTSNHLLPLTVAEPRQHPASHSLD